MQCIHTGYVESDDMDLDEPCTAPEPMYCQHDHGTCDPSTPLGQHEDFYCGDCGRVFCEAHVWRHDALNAGLFRYCAECLVRAVNGLEPVELHEAWVAPARVWLRDIGAKGMVPAPVGAALKGIR